MPEVTLVEIKPKNLALFSSLVFTASPGLFLMVKNTAMNSSTAMIAGMKITLTAKAAFVPAIFMMTAKTEINMTERVVENEYGVESPTSVKKIFVT